MSHRVIVQRLAVEDLHLAIFIIAGDCVRVLRIRRGQRRLLSRPELGEALEPEE